VGDALLEAPVTCHHEGVVVAQLRREVGAQPPLRDPESDTVGEALAERAGGHLHPGRVVPFGVAGCGTPPGAEGPEVVERQPVPRQVEHGVQEDRGVPVGQHEPVAVRPVGLGRVVSQDPGEQDVGQGGEGHGRPRMPRVGRSRRVHGDAADDVDATLLERTARNGVQW